MPHVRGDPCIVDDELRATRHYATTSIPGSYPNCPRPLRSVVAPDCPVIGLVEALDRAGHSPQSRDFALPTHLHWDHVSGLSELPDLAVRTSEIERAHALGGSEPPLGFARGPLAAHGIDTYVLDGPPVLTFDASLDLFGDGSVVLVDLAGHTPGSVGVLLAVEGGGRVLLAGDAVWHGLQIDPPAAGEGALPRPASRRRPGRRVRRGASPARPTRHRGHPRQPRSRRRHQLGTHRSLTRIASHTRWHGVPLDVRLAGASCVAGGKLPVPAPQP